MAKSSGVAVTGDILLNGGNYMRWNSEAWRRREQPDRHGSVIIFSPDSGKYPRST